MQNFAVLARELHKTGYLWHESAVKMRMFSSDTCHILHYNKCTYSVVYNSSDLYFYRTKLQKSGKGTAKMKT